MNAKRYEHPEIEKSKRQIPTLDDTVLKARMGTQNPKQLEEMAAKKRGVNYTQGTTGEGPWNPYNETNTPKYINS